MTKLLIKIAEKRGGGRNAYVSLGSITGIICNLILCALKFTVGAFTGSLSVTADAVNNLSDSASNIVTLTGAKLSDKPDDREHPFGHGRIEYVSALIVAISIIVVGFELAKSSVEKIINPEPIKGGAVYILLLSASVAVKLWMAVFNNLLYKKSENINLKAVSRDSINDCVATAATIVSIVLSHSYGIKRIDGIMGLCVSVFILYSGAGILKQVISPLLGEAPSKELTDRIEAIICESELVLGVHDLVIHSYGVNRMLASADAEVDAKADIFTLHGIIDAAERKIAEELNIEICIHTDPVDKTDTETEKYRLLAQGIVDDYCSAYSLHDFMLSEKDGQKHIHFDLQIPFDEDTDNAEIEKALTEKFEQLCPEYTVGFDIEHSYIQK